MGKLRDVENLAHKLLVIGFEGTTAPEHTLELVRQGVSGVILFARNVSSPEQVSELNRSLKAAAPGLLLSSVDQEGGRVARLREPWTLWPSMRELGNSGSETLAHETGRALGVELKACGFDLNYAPVLDVDTNPDNPVIGDRSFGREPDRVGRMGAALATGLQAVGVGACGKHFPGHGDTSQDSHFTLPFLSHDLGRLREVEMVPFRRAIEAGVASMMTAHVVFEALEPGIPATMSPKAIDGLLRAELGFDGVVFSDDLEMKAVREGFAMSEVVERALLAGVDAFLACKEHALQLEVIEHITRAVVDQRVPLARVEQAAARIEKLVQRFSCTASDIDPSFASRIAGAPEHLGIAARFKAEESAEPSPS